MYLFYRTNTILDHSIKIENNYKFKDIIQELNNIHKTTSGVKNMIYCYKRRLTTKNSKITLP